MKITAISFAFSLVVAALPWASGMTRNCDFKACYEIDSNAEPSATEKAWAAAMFKETYNIAHTSGGDFDMPADPTVDSWSSTPVDGDNNLRGGAGAGAGDYIYQNLFNFIGTVHCDTCRDSDDDDVVPMSGNELGVEGTATHDLWVEEWCTRLKAGPGTYAKTSSCSIEITNCDQSKTMGGADERLEKQHAQEMIKELYPNV